LKAGNIKVVREKYPNVYELADIKNGKEKPVERTISGDRMHKARVCGIPDRGWNMPTGRGKKKVFRSKLQPQIPIAVPEDTIHLYINC
jgi:hypothetical protein